MTVLDLITRMGLVPWLVIILLAAMNVLTLTVGFVKWRQLRALRRSTLVLAPAFARALQDDRLDAAVALTHEHANSPLARVLGDALERAAPMLGDPAYADAAIESYAEFRRLREAGTVPDGVRFQVSVPTPFAVVIAWANPDSQERLWGPFKSALFREVAAIQAAKG